jgi:2',3'-cyclic-nucleotide 2'-phosphodiesterase (5'-nucleotidase family)
MRKLYHRTPRARRAAIQWASMPSRTRRLLALALLCTAPLAAEIRSLTILHTNDVHAHLMPLANGRGGFAYLAAVIRREREGCDHCILLNAGDLVQGTPVSTIFHGLPVYEIANLFGYDAATLGNHEFDYGWMQARKFIEIAKYPIVTANLANNAGELFTPQPYTILDVNGLRVAVIGGMTEELPTLTNPKSMGDWHPLPLVQTLRKYLPELRGKADLIVLVAHIDGAEEQAVLETVPDIAVSITGHLHDGLTEARSHDGRVLVRMKSYGEELGRLDLQVDTDTGKLAHWTWKKIPVDSAAIAPAADVAALVNRWEGQVKELVDRPLAVSRRAFTPYELKSLLERALRDETGADFAFINLGGVREGLPRGQLLERNIWNVMPFDNAVVVGTFKGKDLPAVVLEGRQVDPGRDYTLAVSDFTAANQATRENLRSTGLKFPNEVGQLRDLLLDWFRKKKVIE